jgi:autotransporter-associated beta strand protein
MNHQPRILVRSIATLLTLAALQQANAADRVWNGATGGTWHTVTNWLPNTGFPGEATAAVTGEGLPTDIAQFTGTNVSTNVGINMSTMGGQLTLGAIEVARTAAGNLQIGNNSTTANGILQLNGATVNGVANTLIRVANTAAADLTIANVNTGTGTQTMGLRLGNANGFFTVETGRTLVISSIISQLVANTGYTKNGPGTISISGANTYTGPVVISDGVLRISNATGLGAATATATITVTNADGAAVNDNDLQITGGLTVNRNLVLENTANANARTHLRSTNTINANNNTWSGSVTFKGGSNQEI